MLNYLTALTIFMIHPFVRLCRVFNALIFGAAAAGQAGSFAPNYAKARLAANRIFALIDRIPEIDSYSPQGEEPETVTHHTTLHHTTMPLGYTLNPLLHLLSSLPVSPTHSSSHRPWVRLSSPRFTSSTRLDQKWRC